MQTALALSPVPSLLAACLVLAMGGLLAERVPLLACFCIPAPIIGGLLYSAAALLMERTTGLRVTFDTAARSPALRLFFASIGLTADFSLSWRGR